MPLLLSVDEFVSRATFDCMPDIQARVEATLFSAAPFFENILRTSFDFGIYSDVFLMKNTRRYANTLQDPALDSTINRVRLRQGFIRSDDYTAYSASSIANLSVSDSRVDLRNHPVGNSGVDRTLMDTEKGVLAIHDMFLDGSFVQVNYTAGLEVDSSDEYEDVPNWLKEATYLWALVQLKEDPMIRSENFPVDIPNVNRAWQLIVERHIRFTPKAITLPLS